jgi:hypothetical protein
MILDMITCIKMHSSYFLCPAAADPRPAQPVDETDDDHEPERAMDIDEERDFADQSPLTDMDMEEDAEILSLLLKHMPHYPIPLQGRSAYWTRLCRHAAGPGQRQQALRGKHLDVALRPGPPPDGVYRRGGEDQGRGAHREQDQGGRDEEALQRGRCRSGGGARRRRSGLNTGL